VEVTIMAGSRFTRQERDVIERGRALEWSYRDLGAILGRDPSAICREVNRNKNRHGRYVALGAHRRAHKRAKRPKAFIVDDRRVFNMVFHRIVTLKFSPAATAAELASRGVFISHEAIYQAIYQRFFGDPRAVLCRPRKTRRRRTSTGRGPNSLGDFPSIDGRPQRVGAGHWEADLLSGTANKTAVAVLSETVSRKTLVVVLPKRSTNDVADQLIAIICNRIPKHLRKTLTFDQGREFAQWERIAKQTGFDVYFCHARSPWEKPLVEQTNSLLRRWLPKNKHMPKDQPTIDKIASLLNRMPRRILNWQSAQTVYRELAVATTA